MASRLLARSDIVTCLQLDLAPRFARQAQRPRSPSIVGDEEALPLAPGRFDLITSALALHWVNDLPGALIQIRRALKPDGFFLAAMAGGESLFELRTALQEAEARCHGGLSPRVSPMTDVRDLGGLLQRAGLALPVVDSDTIEITYDSPFKLMHDLRLMGETNAVTARRRAPPGKAFWATVEEIYRDRFALPGGRVLASFDILFMAGWAPAATQQQPLAPGSARHRLADALHTQEQTLPEQIHSKRNRFE
jgi:SAM-dependent methyltransferase